MTPLCGGHDQELADVLSLRDSLMSMRVAVLITGPRSMLHLRSHQQGLANIMYTSMPSWRRFAMLKFVVSLGDTHPQACTRPCWLTGRACSVLPAPWLCMAWLTAAGLTCAAGMCE